MVKSSVQVLYPFWTEQVEFGKGIDDDWNGNPPKLLDPTPMFEEIFRLFY